MLAMKLKVKNITINKEKVALILNDFNMLGNQKLRNAMDENMDSVKIVLSSEPTIEFIRLGQTNADMLRLVRAFLISALS